MAESDGFVKTIICSEMCGWDALIIEGLTWKERAEVIKEEVIEAQQGNCVRKVYDVEEKPDKCPCCERPTVVLEPKVRHPALSQRRLRTPGTEE